MHWKSCGLIFSPDGRYDWMTSHASVPVPMHLHNDIYRVYFSTRNQFQQSQLGFIEIDITRPSEILRISKSPALALGELGAFDCDGVYMTSLIAQNDRIIAYYGGWNSGQKQLFYSAIGIAISINGGEHFERLQRHPILGRDEFDYWALLAPSVYYENQQWHMWYISGQRLYYENDCLKSIYDARYAHSHDGIHWHKTGQCAFPLAEDEKNIGRVCVLKENNIYKAWHPIVKKQLNYYQLGYSESTDGIHFARKHNYCLLQSSGEWDSLVQTYPYVIKHKDYYYMFYNGRNFGQDGLGIAIASHQE